jgi:hypothetical protein
MLRPELKSTPSAATSPGRSLLNLPKNLRIHAGVGGAPVSDLLCARTIHHAMINM